MYFVLKCVAAGCRGCGMDVFENKMQLAIEYDFKVVGDHFVCRSRFGARLGKWVCDSFMGYFFLRVSDDAPVTKQKAQPLRLSLFYFRSIS
jgi:hypothetical protein